MAQIIINGIFYNSRLTGVERFAHEITRHLDMLCKPQEILLLLPAKTESEIPNFKNIQVKNLFKTPGSKQFNNVKLNLYLATHKGICVDFTNHIPLIGKNIVFLHDIYSKVCKNDFQSPADVYLRDKTCKMYARIVQNAQLICTVSEFSKSQIMEHYHVPENKIEVIYNGIEHMELIQEDRKIFEKYPQLQQDSFYFSVGSLSVRKNLKWILEHAKLFPKELFVVSGTTLNSVIPPELEGIRRLKNILCVGYLSDGEVKALMKSCKAFIFPSLFEGFGIPPLEALSCGAPVIVSNSSCLPEIYKDCVHYIDPHNPKVDLEALLKEKVASPEKLFKRYSYYESAKRLYELLQRTKGD